MDKKFEFMIIIKISNGDARAKANLHGLMQIFRNQTNRKIFRY